MLNLGDVLKVSLVVGWPSALDVEAASVWKQSNPFLGDRSHKAQPQMCVERSELVNFGLNVDFKEVGPVPWTLGVSHARRVLSHCGSQPAAQNQGLKQTSESRPLAHVVGLRRCFEVRLGPIVRARPQTSRESTELSARITMLFVQTFRAVELPVRACHKIKHEHSSAAWEARRRHIVALPQSPTCTRLNPFDARPRLCVHAEERGPYLRRLQALRHDTLGRKQAF